MVSDGLLFLSLHRFLTPMLLATYQFKVIVSNDLLLLFKPICEHVEPIKANFDIMSDLHDCAEVR